MAKYTVELLKEINENPDLLAQHTQNNALRVTFQYAFDPALKMNLPEGDPPFKPDSNPLGMSPANYQQETRRFQIFLRTDEQLSRLRRETLFVQLLEGLHPSEAKLLLALKDQNLTSVYPNITADLLKKHGFLPQEIAVVAPPKSQKAEEEPVDAGAKRGRGRPPGAKNKPKENVPE
jgi:hypothetical protein